MKGSEKKLKIDSLKIKTKSALRQTKENHLKKLHNVLVDQFNLKDLKKKPFLCLLKKIKDLTDPDL